MFTHFYSIPKFVIDQIIEYGDADQRNAAYAADCAQDLGHLVVVHPVSVFFN